MLPAKFTVYRPGQLKALERLAKTDKKYILLQGPTGCGKSLVGATLQRMLSTKVLYLVKTIQLEEQLKGDFPYAELLKGRANYPTYMRADEFPAINASLCTRGKRQVHCIWCCTGDDKDEAKCTAYTECPYYMAKLRVLKADLAITNLALFLNEANYVGGLSGFPWMVIDEADLLEESLMSFSEFRVTQRWINRLKLPPPDRKTREDAWVRWARQVARPKLEERLKELQSQWGIESIKEEEEITRGIAKLDFFLLDIETNPWVYTEERNAYVFKPVFVSKQAQDLVWRHASRFLLMSATVIDPHQMCRDLGIPYEEADFIDLKSEFDARRRPVFYSPVVAMSHKTKDTAWRVMVKGIDKALDKYTTQKVLVHTVSTDLAQYIVKNSRHTSRIITYGNGVRREAALQLFTQSKEPKVLVAQSMERGVDLFDDLCRVILIIKVPYLNLGDKQIAKRLYSSRDGQRWYQVQTWRTLIQMTGRGVRHDKDWCLVEILDAEFAGFYRKTKRMAPLWWRESLRGIS